MKRLLIVIALLLGCLWLLFNYRIALIEYGFNYWAKQHELEIISLGDINFSTATKVLHISNARLRKNKSQLTLNDIAISLDEGVIPSAISVENLSLTIDYDSVITMRDKFSNSTDKTDNGPQINLANLPNLDISRLGLNLIGFPQTIIPAPLSHTIVTGLKFNKDDTPTFSMALFSSGQLKTGSSEKQQSLFELLMTYRDDSWHGTLDMELADSITIINTMLPQSLNSIEIAGKASFDFVLSLNNIPEIKVAAEIEDLSIVDNNITLVHSIDIVSHTSFKLDQQIQIAPVTISVTHDAPLLLTQKFCLQVSHLLRKPLTNCQLLSESEQVSVLIASEFNVVADIDLKSPGNWQLGVATTTFDIETSGEKVHLQLNNMTVSEDKISSNIKFEGTTKRISAAKNSAFAIEAQLTKTKDMSLSVNQAQFNFKQLTFSDVVVDELDIFNTLPIDLVFSDGEINTVISSWASKINGVRRQDLVIDNIEGTHQTKLSKKQLELQTNWRVGQLQFSSLDVASLDNYQFKKFSGVWQLPKQSMAGILAIKNPLPPALSIQPQIENVIKYNGKVIGGKLQGSAQITGKLVADRGSYDDIKLVDAESNWSCKSQYTKKITLLCELSGELAQLDVGFPITHLSINGVLSSVENDIKLKLSQGGGKLLGGRFSVQPLMINDFNDIQAVVELEQISLPQIIELQQQEGIDVTGLLKGTLPINYQNNQLTVTDGHIENHQPGGIIKIDGNKTVNQLRLSQPQLVFVLDALENLHYNRLSSSINYQADGQALLKVSIHGRNPTIERPIEFNYSHQENVLQLMRSLRVGDEISKKIEKIAD